MSANLEELGVHVYENYIPTKNKYTQFSTILPEKEYLAFTKEILTLLES